MEKLLIKIIGKKEDLSRESEEFRTKLGSLTALVGVIANLLLTGTKAAIGYLSGSVSILADAFNNLSDTASSIISILGISLSSKASDEEHPYGHGRLEYLATLIVAVAIIAVGINLFLSSIDGIKNPKAIEFSVTGIVLLVLSILVKFWMYKFYAGVSRTINSSALKASSLDSIGDVLATSIVLMSYIFSNFTNFPIDGVAGLVVSAFIFKSGIDLINDMVSKLLGQGDDGELYDDIIALFEKEEKVLSTHDLYFHKYGPHSTFATIDAVVDSDMSVSDVHLIFDRIEHEANDLFGIRLTIHMDVAGKKSDEEKNLGKILNNYIKNSEDVISFHDESMVKIDDETHVSMHIVMDGEKINNNEKEKEVVTELRNYLKKFYPKYEIDIIADRKFK